MRKVPSISGYVPYDHGHDIWMTFISQTANLLYIIKTLNEEKRNYSFYFSENQFVMIFGCHFFYYFLLSCA